MVDIREYKQIQLVVFDTTILVAIRASLLAVYFVCRGVSQVRSVFDIATYFDRMVKGRCWIKHIFNKLTDYKCVVCRSGLSLHAVY